MATKPRHKAVYTVSPNFLFLLSNTLKHKKNKIYKANVTNIYQLELPIEFHPVKENSISTKLYLIPRNIFSIKNNKTQIAKLTQVGKKRFLKMFLYNLLYFDMNAKFRIQNKTKT